MTTVNGHGTEDRVKAAAVQLFGAKGFAATGIRELAHEAGLSIASLYHYMDTKESLLLDLMLDGMHSLLGPASEALDPPGAPAADLVKLVAIHIRFHCERAALAKVTDAELRSLSPESRAGIVELRDAYEKLWTSTVVRGRDSGAFKVSEPRLATLALLEMCTGVYHWYSPGGRYTVDRIADYYGVLALRMLAHPRTAAMRRLEAGVVESATSPS
jgi:AcrR family transcriptional regulator